MFFICGEGPKVFLEPFSVPMPAGLEGPPWQDAETVESTAHVATGRRKRLEMTVIETAFSSPIPVELPLFFSVDYIRSVD